MTVLSALHTYVVPEPFEKALKSIRGALNEMELDLVGELELSEDVYHGSAKKVTGPRILLVSCPILDFEAVVLGRASAVFFPLHVRVAAERDQTRVSVVNPAGIIEARLPVGAGDPMDRLVARVAMAMESIVPQPEAMAI